LARHADCERDELGRAVALDPATGKWTVLRVPYPLGFYQRGMDGRIDDPATGWKARRLVW
jgi:hypothetical protein